MSARGGSGKIARTGAVPRTVADVGVTLTSGDVTGLLTAWRDGRSDGSDLAERVYGELRRIAARQLRGERPGHLLSPTALVNEAYLRLSDHRGLDWQDRVHFFAVASTIMRRILVDHARRRSADKRRAIHVALEQASEAAASERGPDLVVLDEALTLLEQRYPREARVVELRYFAGLTNEETAACLGVSLATVKRDWTFARSFLRRKLGDAPP